MQGNSTSALQHGTAARIEHLDLIRGVAVLGILLMNIISFGMPVAAFANPTAYGDFSGIHQWTWALIHIFAEQKFIAMFGMLFGAGIVLMASREAPAGLTHKQRHFRRLGWLALFGLAHAWLLWYGDILFTYAVAGCLAWLAIHKSVRALWTWGLILYALPALLLGLMQLGMQAPESEFANDMQPYWAPGADLLAQEISAVTGGFVARTSERAEIIFGLQTSQLLLFTLWTALGYMLIGMALFKQGVLQGQASQAVRMVLLALFIPGVLLVTTGVVSDLRSDFAIETAMFGGMLWNYVGSLGMALAYIVLLACWANRGWLPRLQHKLKQAGRMAFSLYIMQTLIGVVIFNWIGLFAQLQRFELLLLVVAIWIAQLAFASWYLGRFQHGPLEWLWRRLVSGPQRSIVK